MLFRSVQCWRPPCAFSDSPGPASLTNLADGDVDDRVRWIAQALGMRTVMWSEDTSDWKISTIGIAAVETNYNNIIAKSKNGTFATYSPIGTPLTTWECDTSLQALVVLTHELNNGTMELCESFLPRIQETFTHVMPVGLESLYGHPRWADHLATQMGVCRNVTEPYVEQGGRFVYPVSRRYGAAR